VCAQGMKKRVGFQFNALEDTPESIGLEMVEQLALNAHQVRGAGLEWHCYYCCGPSWVLMCLGVPRGCDRRQGAATPQGHHVELL